MREYGMRTHEVGVGYKKITFSYLGRLNSMGSFSQTTSGWG